MEDNIEFQAECVCGSTHFMHEDGKTFCMECQTELESAKEIVYDTVDYVLETGDLTQRSRVLTTTVKKQTGTVGMLISNFDEDFPLFLPDMYISSPGNRITNVMGMFQSNIM